MKPDIALRFCMKLALTLAAIIAFHINSYGQKLPGPSFDTDIRQIRFNSIPDFHHTYDDYLQYSPAALMLGLKAFGYEGRTGWGRMLVSDAFSAAIMAGAVNGIKYSVRRIRPDNSQRNSFPSGHTATAFMCATFLHKEYGWRSPWFSIGGYTAATVTGISRILNNRHWMSDIVAGAAIGIGSVQLGYFLSDLIFRDRYLAEGYSDPVICYDPEHRYYNIELFFARRFMPGMERAMVPDRGSSAGITADIPVTARIGCSARISATSLTDLPGKPAETTYNLYSLTAGSYCSWHFARILDAGPRVMAGYAWNRNTPMADISAGGFLSMLVGDGNFRIKAFAEYGILAGKRTMPNIQYISIGYSASVCW